MMDTVGAVLAPLAVMAMLRVGITGRTVLWLALIPIAAAFAILLLVREGHHRPSPHRLITNLRNLPPSFRRLLKGIGLFGSGDFAHSLMILYAVSALTPSRGATSAAAVAAGLYALHNVFYAGVSYPIGTLADRSNKYILLALGYACGAGTAFLLMSNATSFAALAAIFALEVLTWALKRRWRTLWPRSCYRLNCAAPAFQVDARPRQQLIAIKTVADGSYH
jgi:hypothetical protein